MFSTSSNINVKELWGFFKTIAILLPEVPQLHLYIGIRMWQKYEPRTRISLNSRLKGSAHVWILHVQAHEAIKGSKDDSMKMSMSVQTWTLGLWEAQKYMSVDKRVLESEEANLESLLIFFSVYILVDWVSC